MKHPGRLAKIREIISAGGPQALLVTKPANVRYLSGFTAREASLLILPDRAWIVSDFRYALQAEQEAPGFEFMRVQQPMPDLAGRIRGLGLASLGFEPGHLTVQQHAELSQHLPDIQLVGVPDAVESLRLAKEQEEILLIRKAARFADAAMDLLWKSVAAGKSERELALEVEFFIRRSGADDVAFEVIVASGPRAAMPHARPSERRIAPGDLVIMDLGACCEGYRSDLTRTVVVGEASDTAKRIYEVCYEAQQAGLAALKAGVPCAEVDAAARALIERAGYGGYFGHGLGHGVGLEIHEAPRLSPTDTTRILEPGMVVTVEPAIYLPSVGGVRIEDLVLVTEKGSEVLTRSRKPATIAEV
jgi:Xaa-Pro aminopeptidase